VTPEPPELPAPAADAALAADAAAAHATDPHAGGSGHHGPFHSHCENCGTRLEGPWCHRCGQHDFEFHRSFRHVFMEALESFFHFDGTFFRTTRTLLFQPGRLTAEFNAGKRASQMPPFRLYVFVAFVFFLVMHFGGAPAAPLQMQLDDPAPQPAARRGVQVGSEALTAAVAELAAEAKAAAPAPAPASAAPAADAAGQPAATAQPPLKIDDSPALERWLNDVTERASDPVQKRLLAEKFFAAIPKMLLVCLPIFALLTRLLYRRARDFVYLKHLVLALHFHTFIYLWTLAIKGLVWVAGFVGLGGLLDFGGEVWLVLYPFFMFRHLFGGTWPGTIAKTLLLALGYGLVVSLGIAATAVIVYGT